MNYFKLIDHYRKLYFALISILFFTQNVFATHNRAGEITYKHIGVTGYNYEVTITTYTKISAPADRPELEIFWGDNSSDTIPRTNGNGVPVAADIKRNEYVATHVYPGPADYIISFTDQNRNGAINNISGSVNIAFYVESHLTILPVSVPNSSPILQQPPIDDGAINQLFIHNPGAVDPDGDSISYELTPCRDAPNHPIATFSYPSASNSFTINSYTGDLIWDSPTATGEYNMAIIIREWRNIPNVGIINIGSVIRDMQVTIFPSSNHPPVIANLTDTCVEAGTFLTFPVIATDQDNDVITLTAYGAPFLFNPDSAQVVFTPANGYCTPPVNTIGSCSNDTLIAFINNVTIPHTTLNRNSTCNSPYISWPASGSTTALLVPGTTDSILIGVTHASSSFFSVWIDFNQNGIFDSVERVAFSTTGSNVTTFGALMTIPSNTLLGTTIMRVRVGNVYVSGFPSAITDPCTALSYGETEDYRVTFIPGIGISVVAGVFRWNTSCAHVHRNPYSVVFKAKDNSSPVNLADLETVFITIVGPSPKNPSATPQTNGINLNWNQSACSNAIGYKIYRHSGYYGFIPSHCETGVPAYTGYTLIHTQIGLTDTTFFDDNNGQGLATGINYCYMITAIYQDQAESYASLEVCASLKLDLPVITNADVLSTDNSNGKIYVAWSKPLELDTVQWQGPYRYILQRATSTGTFSDVVSFTNLNDTTYIDSTLNTDDNQYRYKIKFLNETNSIPTLIGTTQIANSVFLTINPGDNRLFLSWNVNVPWTDTLYVIYKQNISGTYDSISSTRAIQYIDSAVVNGNPYCYKIESFGTYGISGLLSPTINKSEEECQTPKDVEPPCVPASFNASANCELAVDTIRWSFTGMVDSCKTSDIKSFNLYFIPTGTTDTGLVATVTDPSATYYVVTDAKNLAGCYFITITDTNNNTSEPSKTSCTEGCPRYFLPNFFTPDFNGINDFFHPIEYKYSDVKDIDLTIFNRWGDVVFKTNDPDIKWNGKRNNTGKDVPGGVYFYICTVNEIFLDGVRPRLLKGFIEVIRGSQPTNTQ